MHCSGLPDEDKALYEALGYGARAGFGLRPALLIIDATVAFCGDEPRPITEAIKLSRTSCGQHAWQAIPVISRLAETARHQEMPVIYSTNTFRTDKWDTGSWAFKKKRGASMAVAHTALDRGNEIVECIAPTARDLLITKQKPSAFFGSNLASYLTLLRCDSLIVCGGTTSGCVRATVVDAFSLNYRVAVVREGCFDRFIYSHESSLFDIDCRYADVVSERETIDFMKSVVETFDLPPADHIGQ